MEKRELTCIGCPLGCSITVTMENAEILDVTGNTCKRGAAYAVDECTNPKRTLTSTVKTTAGEMLSVKTAEAVPFGKLFDVMHALSGVTVKTPVHIGQVILADVCGTGVDVVATKNLD